MKLNPATLLIILLALGGAAALFLAGVKPEPPPVTALKVEVAPIDVTNKAVEDLKKQIVLLNS